MFHYLFILFLLLLLVLLMIDVDEREGEYVVEAQSRTRVLRPTSDLDGLAKWVASHNDSFIHVRKALKVFLLFLSSFFLL